MARRSNRSWRQPDGGPTRPARLSPALGRRGISLLARKGRVRDVCTAWRSEEHTSELQSLMRISYAVFCLKKKNITNKKHRIRSKITYRTNTQSNMRTTAPNMTHK